MLLYMTRPGIMQLLNTSYTLNLEHLKNSSGVQGKVQGSRGTPQGRRLSGRQGTRA